MAIKAKLATTIIAATIVFSAACIAATEQIPPILKEDAQTTEPKPADQSLNPIQPGSFKWGGDIRLRDIYFDNIPTQRGGHARGGANHFQRYRFRFWGEYHHDDRIYLRARLVNEFRTGQSGFSYQTWEPMDETVFDNLFIDWKTSLWDIRIGRQDLVYGTGKVILEGTPLDGSRTIYFDAARAIYKGIGNTTVDFLAMYTRAQDPLAIYSRNRDIVGRGGSGYTGAEAGGGIYVKNYSKDKLPWEAYYIIKTREDDINNPGHRISGPVSTVGTRLLPENSNGAFTANLELAYQFSKGVDGYMIDALASWSVDREKTSTIGLGWYHLSEDWNPVFARWPQNSELYVYAQAGAAGRWSNLSMPHIDFSITTSRLYKAELLLGYMFAPAKTGPGSGDKKGLLLTWWNRFTLKKGLFSRRDRLGAHLLLELMKPGDYYTRAQRDEGIGVFIRGELTYSF